jgi:hypothetical protein
MWKSCTCRSIDVSIDNEIVWGPAQGHAAPCHAPLHRLKRQAAPVRQPGLSLQHVHHSSCSSSSASRVSEQHGHGGSSHRDLSSNEAESDKATATEAAVIHQTATVTAQLCHRNAVTML